jgi:putative flippase GtrA
LFLLVGAFCAGLNLGLIWLQVDGLHWSLQFAVLSAFVASNYVGYQLNGRFSFNPGQLRKARLGRYYAVMAVSALGYLGLITLLVNGLGLAYLWAAILTTGLMAVVNFAAHRRWTFD